MWLGANEVEMSERDDPISVIDAFLCWHNE